MMSKPIAAALAVLFGVAGAADAQAQRRGPVAGPMLPAFAWEAQGTMEQEVRFDFETRQHNARLEDQCVKYGCLIIINPNRDWEVPQWELNVRRPGSDKPDKWVTQFQDGQFLGVGGRMMVATRGVDGTSMCAVPALFTMREQGTGEESLVFISLNFCDIQKGAPRMITLPLKAKGRVILEYGEALETSTSAVPVERP